MESLFLNNLYMGSGCLGAATIVAIIVGLSGTGYYLTTVPRQNLSPTPQVVQIPTVAIEQSNPEDTSMKQGTFEMEPPLVRVCKDIDISIVVDISGSMGESVNGVRKIEFAKQAASALADTLVAKQTADPSSVENVRLGVVSFGWRGDANDPVLGNIDPAYTPATVEHMILTSNFVAVKNAIASMNQTGGATCIQCGLYVANRQFDNENTDKIKVIILLSDGEANRIWSGENPGPAVSIQKAIEQANIGRDTLDIEYRVVGFGDASGHFDPNTLQAIAGSTANYQFMTDPSQWASAFLTILEDVCEMSANVN